MGPVKNFLKNLTETLAAPMAFILVILLLVAGWGITYLIIAGLTYIICLAFDLPWSWLIALGVWAVIILARYVIKAASGGSSK